MKRIETDQVRIRRRLQDWEFVSPQIKEALTNGQPLDEAFVAQAAVARLEHTLKTSEYSRFLRLDATLQASTQIVKDILDVHVLLGEAGPRPA